MTDRVTVSPADLAFERPRETLTAADRLGFSVFLALALHLVLILGIGFTWPEAADPPRTMEVTLARTPSEVAPEDADFLAAEDSIGSGALDRPQPMTSPEPEPAPTPSPAPARDAPDPAAPEPTPEQPEIGDRAPLAADDPPEQEDAAERSIDAARLLDQALIRGGFRAQEAERLQADAAGRRVRRISSASTRTAVEAAYLQGWRRKVESIGNLNYPEEARRRGLEGDLKVLVEIAADGELLDVRVLESSGSTVLDEAAVRIVRMGAPYLPFPEPLRATTDVLQIVRTWQFRRRGFGSG